MWAAQKRGELPAGTAERWSAETPDDAALPRRVKKRSKKDVEEHADRILNRMHGGY
jgi:hypothetical protein